MTSFTIKGTVEDEQAHALTGMLVQAIDSNQRWFESHIDDILGSAWLTKEGSFEIHFSQDPSDSSSVGSGWSKGYTDLYIVVRNSRGQIIYRSDTRKDVKPNDVKNLTFDLILSSTDKQIAMPADPYANSNEMVFSDINGVEETIDLSIGDTASNFALLKSAFNAWFIYSQEPAWRSIGYDGPQVPRYPWREPHNHKLEWESKQAA